MKVWNIENRILLKDLHYTKYDTLLNIDFIGNLSRLNGSRYVCRLIIFVFIALEPLDLGEEVKKKRDKEVPPYTGKGHLF